MRNGFVALVAAVAPLLIANACARFSEAEQPSDASAADVASDASDGAPRDVAGEPTLGCPETLLVDDFEGAFDPRWSTSPAPLTPNQLTVAAGELRLDLPVGSKLVTLFYPVPSGVKRYCFTARMRVDTVGGGEVNFFGIEPVDRSLNGHSIVLVHQLDATFAFEFRAANGDQASTSIALPMTTWFPVTFEIDLEGHTLAATAATERFTTPIDPAWPLVASVLKVGAPYVLGTKAGWRVRFDDVRLGVAR